LFGSSSLSTTFFEDPVLTSSTFDLDPVSSAAPEAVKSSSSSSFESESSKSFFFLPLLATAIGL
jgi:hypothetical protein